MAVRWITPDEDLPPEKALVTIRTRAEVRPRYYRIEDRWYSLGDLHRWRMNTSPYWNTDRAWYLKTEQIDAWACRQDEAPENGASSDDRP